MMGPPLFCRTQDTLYQALELMRIQTDSPPLRQRGWLLAGRGGPGLSGYRGTSLPLLQQVRAEPEVRSGVENSLTDQLRIREVMTPEIYAQRTTISLQTVMEGLSAFRFGALLIQALDGSPAGWYPRPI